MSINKPRTVILTCSVAAITATGVWYGAGLKTRQEYKGGIRAEMEAAPAEIITRLEESRVGLVAKRTGLESKITELEARQRKERKVEDAR